MDVQAIVQAIISRARELLLDPKSAWTKIDTESADVQTLYKTYIAPLAAIPVIATFIGMSVLGLGAFHFPIGLGLGQLLVSYALSLASVYVFALIIDYLAPQFGAQKNFAQAFKVAAYGPTASWLAGIFAIIPALAILSILGALYSFYLLFVGIPILMKVPDDKAMVYTLASIGCAIVLSVLVGLLVSRIFVPPIAP